METVINGKRVVFRDKFPARFGWGLLGAVQRIDVKRAEMSEDKDDIPAELFFIATIEVLTFDEVTQFIRGAVESWEFDGDLDTEAACENLSPINELLPLATKSLMLFYTEKISGEAVGPSTPASGD